MSSNTIVPTAQITALKQGLDKILAPIKQALQDKVYVQDLPIVGSLLGSAATQGQAALQQFGTLETDVFNAINAINGAPATVAAIQNAISNALVSAGFAPNGVQVAVDPTSGTLTVTLNDAATDSFTTALGSNFGLPGLDFQTAGSAQTTLGYALDVTTTVDTSGNVAVSSPGPAALTVNLDVTAPTFAATGTLGASNDTLLGDLRFGAIDNGSSLQGSFSLDTSGDATFTGNSSLNVQLTSDMGSAALPSISADLVGGWNFADSTVDTTDAASFGDMPTIALDNVTYKLGSFVDNFIDPVIDDVNAVLQSAPVKIALQLFNTPLDFLGGGLVGDAKATGNNGLLGSLWKDLDVGGAIDPNTGADVGDGQITLVDFLQLAANAGAPIDVTPIVEFLNAVTAVQNWVSALAASGTSFGSTTYSLGSFSIPDDIRTAVQQISQVVPVQDPGAPAQDLNALLASLAGGSGSSGGSSPSQTPAQALQSLLTSQIFSFPIITNPAEAIQFLLGGTVDLFDANLPPATLNIGSINSAGAPTSTVPLLSVPIPTPLSPLINIDLALGAAFQGTVGLDFGYDTSGLTAYKNSGFTVPADILNGLFVEAPTINGTVEPVVQLAGAVQLGATLSAGALASISASGDVGGVLDLTFAQPGKNYVSKLISELQTTPYSIFTASGQITAGFEAVARAIFLSPWVYTSPRATLAQFNSATTGVTSGSSEPQPPTDTTWIGGATGDFETASKWSPTFVQISGIDYYGDATINAGSTVTFQGPANADLTSLTLAAGSTLNLTKNALTIEDSTTDSPNSGTIVVGGTAQLFVQDGFDNTGTISVTTGTLIASGLMALHGGGSLLLPNATGNFIQSTDPDALLFNEDNTISGGGTIGAALLNKGVVNANAAHVLLLSAADTNEGTIKATGNQKGVGAARTGGLDIAGPLDNSGGTIAAVGNGIVLFQNGITISGGTLQTPTVPDGSIITTAGSVTLDGGTDGMTIAGLVQAGSGSILTLTGLITSQPFSATLGQSAIVSGNGSVLLQGATIHNGSLDARVLATGAVGTIAVSGTATLDGSGGGIGLDGLPVVGAGDTLVLAGVIDPGLAGGGIDLAGGTLVIGDAATDAVTFGTSLPGSLAGTGGMLTLEQDDIGVVTGADADSLLTNYWDIAGSGTLGNGQLTIVNTASGTISALGVKSPLVLNAGLVINDGLINVGFGSLDLQSNVDNAGGEIQALFAGIVSLDGATIAGGEISGGGPAFGFGGGYLVTGQALLDGTAAGSPVTLVDDAQVVVQAGDTLTLAGSIINQATLDVFGNGTIGTVATLVASGSVSLSGGGMLTLLDASGIGGEYQQIVGTAGGTLDNINNLISGYGEIGAGENTLTLMNEAAGTVDATGGTLILDTGTQTATNHGLFEATAGGTFDLHGSIVNAGATLLAANGIALLDNVQFSGGTIVTTGTGSVRTAGSATLDGSASAVVVAAGARVAVDAGDVLTVTGTLVNHGTMQATGGTLGLAAGTIAVTNLGQLRADAGGLDLSGTITNAGGTILATAGEVILDGVTVNNGLLTSPIGGAGFFEVVNNATLFGAAAVAATVTTSPTAGLLNTGEIHIDSGDKLTLRGTITNRGVIRELDDGGTATLAVSGTVGVTGGGFIDLGGASGASGDLLITGGVAGDTLDNIDNNIVGYGDLGAGDGRLTLINETSGRVEAADGTLFVNTGTKAVVNKGLMDATTGGVLDLQGTVTNTGMIVADGGSVQLDGATINGGTLATSAGGLIVPVGTATLNAVTLAPAAQVVTNAGGALVLQGSIVNHTTLAFDGSTYFTTPATLEASGTASLSGGGAIVLNYADLVGVPAKTNTLDNINNTISGYGQIGSGDASLTLINEAAGTIVGEGSTLIVNTGTKAIVNKGLLDSGTTGALDLHGTITNTGGRIAADGGSTYLDGAIVTGGTFTDSAGGDILVSGAATLNGVTVAAGSEVDAPASTSLTLQGSIVNHGTLGLAGSPYYSVPAILLVSGTVALSGGGLVASTESVIDGSAAGALLDNIDNTIAGYGSLGTGLNVLKVRNEVGGTIEATGGGALVVNTGINAVTNLGVLEATGGTLVLQGVLDDTGGGTLVALDLGAGGAPGIIQLDGATVRGGTLRTDTTDPTSQLQETANGGTLDGSAGALTLAPGAVAAVVATTTLTVKGTIVNHGTVLVEGSAYYDVSADLLLAGAVTLSGGGSLVLADIFTPGQGVTGATAAASLDNVDNLISGYGQLGAGQLTLTNEVKGVIDATGGVLVVDTAAKVVINKGLMEADGGTLDLHGIINDTGGGTIAALDTGGVSGIALLDGATLRGGTIVTDLHDPASTLTVSTNGGTLDGTAGAITLAAGAQAEVGPTLILTVQGTIAGTGTLSVLGSGYYGEAATAELASNVTLTGGGVVALADGSTLSTNTNSQIITGASASVTLDNVSDTIRGYGSLGAGSLTLVNAAGGVVDGTGGLLQVDTGTKAITNQGLLEAVAGTLELDSAVTNSGTIFAGAGGDVVIDGTVTNTGLVSAGNGGTVTLHGVVTGAASKVQVASGGTLVIDGGSLRNGTLTSVAGGIVDIVQSSGTLASVAFNNAGTANIIGYSYYGYAGTLSVAGTTTLSGGGSVALADYSGSGTDNQIVTGVAAGDTLDNVDNTISGYGELGAGQLTLINETKGTIEATTAILLVNTGSVALANHGLLEANSGGTLVVQTVVNDTSGGTVLAQGSGTLAGVVLLDGGTLRGGSIITHGDGALLITAAGGTLDGTAGAVTLAAGSQAIVAPAETLTLKGPVTEYGTLDVQGYSYYGYIGEVLVGGTLTLASGALLSLVDASGIASNTQVIAGSAAGAKLDNSALISGYGMLGDGSLVVVNEAVGTIEATGGTFVIDSGAGKTTNLGQMIAAGGTLQIENTLTNASTIAAGPNGGIVVDGTVTNAGLVSVAATGTLTLNGSIVGTASNVRIAGGGLLDIDGGSLRNGTLTSVAGGIVNIVESTGTLASVAFSNAGTVNIIGYSYYGYGATLSVAGTTTLSGGGSVALADYSGSGSSTQIITGVAAGDTLDNVDNTISGYGELGAGQLTLINEAKGVIDATISALVINTGSVALVNHGLLEATGGTLLVQTVVDDTVGGTISALSSSTGSGVILLDGGTLRGGSVQTDPTSALLLTGLGGTLDGTGFTLRLAAGSHATVAATDVLTLEGVIASSGRIDIQGNGYYGEAGEVQVNGTVTLSGGGVVTLTDTSGLSTASNTQVITGTTTGAKLDNIDNTFIGYGMLGAGQLTVVNEAAGTIDASGGDLIVDAGAGHGVTNAGLMQALSGTLDVVSSLANNGVVLAGGGTVILEGPVTGTGKLELVGSDLFLDGSVAAGQTILFGDFGTSETLDITGTPQIGGTIGGFASGDAIVVQNASLTAAIYHATSANLGTLVLQSGTTAIGTLTLSGAFTANDFLVQALPDGTSVVSLIAGVGTVYRHAAASTAVPNPVNFGQHHVGDALSQILTIGNTAVAGSGTESLDASIGNATGAATAIGSFTLLAAGKSDATHLAVGLSTHQDGKQSGTAILALSSDGTGVDSLGATPLGSQTIAVTGTLFNYATASAASPVNFGNQHVGGNATLALSVGNSGATDGFTEKLDAAFGAVTGSLTVIGSFKTLAAGQTNASSLTLKLASAHDGAQSGTAALTLKSDGTGIDTLGTTALTTQTITATGTFYNYATASLAAPNPVNFGKHHVGDVLAQTLSIINTGTVDGFTENLDGSIGGVTGSVTASGSFTGLAASKSDTSDLTVGLASGHDGVRSGTAVLSLSSDGTGIDSLGTTSLTSQTIAATGTLYNYATAGVTTTGTVSFGERHVGDALLAGLSISNLGTADGFTENLDVTYGATTGAGLASTPVSGIAAGNAKAAGVGLASTHDGVQGGSVALLFSSDGTGIDNLGTTALTSQTIAATGTLFNYATAATTNSVNFGNHHVGDTLTRTLTVTNTGTADGYTEALNASLGGGTGGATGSGSFTGLDASLSNAGTLTIGLAATADGVHSGAATLSLTSNGAGIDTLGTKALTAQTITAAATLYSLAAPVLSTTTLDFGAYRLGGTAPTRSLTIADGTTADAYQENLSYGFHSPSSGFVLNGAASGLVVSGGTHATASWTVNAAVSGVLTTSTDLLDFTSVGAGTSGLANTALASTRIALLAKVYAPAVAQLGTGTINFGVVHVGDVVSSGDTVTNVVAGSLTDVLTGGVGTVTGAAFSASGTLGSGLASGASTTLTFALNTGTSGVFTGSAALALKTHDADLADAAVSAGPVTLSGTVDNYATAAIEELSGGGSFTHSGSVYTLNLGAVVVGSTAPTVDLGVLNAANGLADLLSGSFDVSGSGFVNTGFSAFSGEAAGQADTTPSLSLSTSQVGTFTESVTLLATGSNTSGYSAALHQEVLNVTGVVTAQPRTLIWTGDSSTNFADAGNFNDVTSGKNPALTAPGAADSVQFGAGGGAVTGTGMVSGLSFGGNGTWNLASAASLTAVGSVTVGSAQPGALTIGSGASIVQTGTGAAVIAGQSTAGGSSVGVNGAGANWQITGDLEVGQLASGLLDIISGGSVVAASATIASGAGASGSDVTVTGPGSAWEVGGALTVGGAGEGALSVANGATVTATTLDAGVAAGSSGIVTVTDAALITTGSLSIGDAGVGELSILNGANVTIGGDFDIGLGAGGSGNVDIEDTTGTVYVGGNLNIGQNGGPAVLTVGPGSTLEVDNGFINGGPGGVLNLYTSIDPLVVKNLTINVAASDTTPENVTAYTQNDTFNLAEGADYILNTPSLVGTNSFTLGTVSDTDDTTLILNADTVSATTAIAFTNALGTLVIGTDQLATINSPTSGKSETNPNDGDAVIGGFHGVIKNFTAGDAIMVNTAGPATFTQSGSVISVIENGITVGVLAFDTAASAQAAFTAPDALVDNALCFLAGTLIGTPEGQIEVERLAAGDRVLTASGAVRPVMWVGHGRVLATRGRRGPATPVIVRKGALAPNVPHQDLRVTKGHAFWFDGVLIPVEFLVNHRSILWDDRAQEVSVYHVELDAHDVLLANGAAAESYRDDGNRWLFQNANAGWDLPAQAPCAEVLTGGPVVDAVWRRLLEACGPRPSVPLTPDADVHLVVDGVRVDGVRTGDIHVFAVSASGGVHLGSRSAVPQELGMARDPRCLGVALRRMSIRQGTRFRTIRGDDARLADGFHAFETDTGVRWTDGDATLPAVLFDGFSGSCEVVVHLGGTARYIDDGAAEKVA